MAMTLESFKTDLQTRIEKLTADVAAQTTIDASVKTLLTSQTQAIADLRAQVASLSGQGVDASVLQPVLDAFDVQTTALEAASADLTAAVTANTGPAPAPAA